MADGATIRLGGEQSRQLACWLVQEAPEGWVVQINAAPRTLAQSSRFWATCSDVAQSPAMWGGTSHDKMGWHDLFLSGWNVAKEHPPRMLIGLEGERVSLVRHTRWMTEADMSDLLDYTTAWCAMRGIELKE